MLRPASGRSHGQPLVRVWRRRRTGDGRRRITPAGTARRLGTMLPRKTVSKSRPRSAMRRCAFRRSRPDRHVATMGMDLSSATRNNDSKLLRSTNVCRSSMTRMGDEPRGGCGKEKVSGFRSTVLAMVTWSRFVRLVRAWKTALVLPARGVRSRGYSFPPSASDGGRHLAADGGSTRSMAGP